MNKCKENCVHMDSETINKHIEGCLYQQAPPCAYACPIGVDILGFIKKVRRGNLAAAYRMYRERAVFPMIATHLCAATCQMKCYRECVDEAVNIQALEQACVALYGEKIPEVYNIPSKNKKIAIIGAGLAGLTCAYRLAWQGYEVSVYEADREIGGTLNQSMESEVYLNEFQRQFTGIKYSLKCNVRINNVDLLEADAVFVATGTAGECFSEAKNQERIFRGGKLTGAKGTEIIRDGTQSARDIKAFLDLGRRSVVSIIENPRDILMDMMSVEQRAPVVAENEVYSKSEAIEEANRCLLCQCNACQSSCDLMTYYNKNPKRIADDIYATLHQVPSYTNRLATRLSNACNQCGVCEIVCPQSIHLGGLFLETRKEMYRDGYMPKAFHHFWLQDMAFAIEECVYVYPKNKKVDYLFFPGCHLGGNNPDYVLEPYRWLMQQSGSFGILLSCCGAPARWGGAEEKYDEHMAYLFNTWKSFGEPTMLFACATCQKFFDEIFPQIPKLSIYEYMAPIFTNYKERISASYFIFDPCSAQEKQDMRQAVRDLSRLCVAHIENEDIHIKQHGCCGWGGHIYPADKKLYDYIVQKRINLSAHTILTYCINCKNTFSVAGKSALHLFDLVFDIHNVEAEVPSISQRRENRRNLIRFLKGEQPVKKLQRLILTNELRKQMERDLISDDDVLEVISYAESEILFIENKITGHKIAHKYLGNSTCWVEYCKKESLWEIHSVYSHRMVLEERGVDV